MDIMRSGYKENEALPTINFKVIGRYITSFDPNIENEKVVLVGNRFSKISLMVLEKTLRDSDFGEVLQK